MTRHLVRARSSLLISLRKQQRNQQRKRHDDVNWHLFCILQLLGHVETCESVAAVNCEFLGSLQVTLTGQHFDLRRRINDAINTGDR